MKKIKYLLLLPFLLLTSCGDNSLTGVYGFALGNQSGSHFGVYANLSNEDYVEPNNVLNIGGFDSATLTTSANEDTILKKQFNLVLDIPEETIDNSTLKQIGQMDEGSDLALSDGTIRGYYYFGKTDDNGLRVHLGVGLIDKIFGEIFEETEISEKLMQYIICAYLSEKTLNIRIPVSLKDLQLQLLWYGFYLNIETLDFIDLFERTEIYHYPGPGGNDPTKRDLRIGTLPNQDDINELNSMISRNPQIFTDPQFSMRFVHIIRLGLKKM